MFFIVIPLAGVMVRERELGVHQRLEIAPVWHLDLMLGRIFAFVGLNLVQLWLMLAVGVYILPLFDMPTLQVANHVGLIFATGICASLAATGFGLLIGTWASTYEQATVLGPFVIVIAAAIGGILAPVDLMPSFLQKISGLSPLNWAQSAFLDIFVRNASFHTILPNLLKLLGFFCVNAGAVLDQVSASPGLVRTLINLLSKIPWGYSMTSKTIVLNKTTTASFDVDAQYTFTPECPDELPAARRDRDCR